MLTRSSRPSPGLYELFMGFCGFLQRLASYCRHMDAGSTAKTLDSVIESLQHLRSALAGESTTEAPPSELQGRYINAPVWPWFAAGWIVARSSCCSSCRLAPAGAAAQPGRHWQHGANAGLQHDLELHDQHEPSALQRRDRPVVFLANGGHYLPAVRDGRDGRGRLHRCDSRPCREPHDAAW